MKEGILLSEKLYERRFHAETPAWDYKIVMVWRDWAALEEAHHRDPQIKRELYPDQEELRPPGKAALGDDHGPLGRCVERGSAGVSIPRQSRGL